MKIADNVVELGSLISAIERYVELQQLVAVSYEKYVVFSRR